MNTRWLIQKVTRNDVYLASGAIFTALSLVLLVKYLRSHSNIQSFPSIFLFNKLLHGQTIQASQTEQKLTTDTPISYSTLQSITKNRKLPAAMVDLDKFDRNTDKIAELIKKHWQIYSSRYQIHSRT